MASERKVILKSSDDKLFDVTEAVASKSQIIKYVIEDVKREDKDSPLVIPLPEVSSKILSKAIEYCKYHVEAQSAISEEETQIWDKEFVKVDLLTLFDLNLAADYLNIKGLLELTFQTVADMLKGKTPEGIRE